MTNAVFLDVTPCGSKERGASIIRVTRIGEVGATLAVTSNRRTLRRNPCHPDYWGATLRPRRRHFRNETCSGLTAPTRSGIGFIVLITAHICYIHILFEQCVETGVELPVVWNCEIFVATVEARITMFRDLAWLVSQPISHSRPTLLPRTEIRHLPPNIYEALPTARPLSSNCSWCVKPAQITRAACGLCYVPE
jgi:hypothetical protein